MQYRKTRPVTSSARPVNGRARFCEGRLRRLRQAAQAAFVTRSRGLQPPGGRCLTACLMR